MNETCRPDGAFAIVFSMPLFVAVSAWPVPWLWDAMARSIGWNGPNPTRAVRDWFMGNFDLFLIMGAAFFSRPVVIFCSRPSDTTSCANFS